ncbi:EAL domain-containing protein [Microbacterium sp. M3]|jgi:EAL domain-containing protein (putative c-di-GMP-specific phosphodiesterase class I)|uniref:EAL domain-containing protein n=1 Tax=Microbacterium arthrosphaerae TaxID=792652 RepID=A0ABU4H2G3_9MICO|nr:MULTISPECIES: EAL domain-containing protein [Microbacterium]MDW4572089.1 EAL domain-containing protein [Microbacterium arthrosphaerae]MDW7605944.1 EAL domain-containing protein [Microbacterium sp. M3]
MLSTTQLTRDLRSALSAGELTIAFQGQYDLVTAVPTDAVTPAAPVAVEALCRWQHAQLGAVPPDRFIPLAEQGEFLDDIDAHVFARAAAQVAAWRDEGHVVGLAVNASPAHFSSHYADTIVASLDALGLDPAIVTIEITEAPLPQLRPGMLSAIEALHAIGTAISVDDFAAGDTTVQMLEVLPIDEVKIDRSLTQRTDAAADDVIAAVVEISTGHGWRVVAEGIETLDDLERARTRGCHRGQGYLWGMPLPAEQMDPLLAWA